MAVGKTRGPVVVWLLSLVTCGIYFFWWYYTINQELKDFDPTIEVNPGIAAVSQVVPIANLVSFFNTGGRIAQAQSKSATNEVCSGIVGLLLEMFVFGVGIIYYQSQLNKLWAAVPVAGGAPTMPPPGAPTGPPPTA